MNVLSLFDGMSCCRIALEQLGIKPNNYYAAEIDKFAIKMASHLYPDTKHLGDVTKWQEWNIDYSKIDLVTGGFPCQAWSTAGKQLGDKDERGKLFWVMLDVMQVVLLANPNAKFLIENVKMKKEFEEYITHHTRAALGNVHKILINSALVSAQNRNRYYWCNWHSEQPEDKGILLKDILEQNACETYSLSNKLINGFYNRTGDFAGKFKPMNAVVKQKSYCLTARYFKNGITDPYILTGDSDENMYGFSARRLTPIECAQLQTIPEPIIDKILKAGISNTQLYKMLGNGWTIDVIAHLFSSMELPVQIIARQLSLFTNWSDM